MSRVLGLKGDERLFRCGETKDGNFFEGLVKKVIEECQTRARTSPGAELYDPATGNWTVTGSLNEGREEFPAALLSNGKVLVAGGYKPFAIYQETASAELYDPGVTATPTPNPTPTVTPTPIAVSSLPGGRRVR